jgi:protein-S-isoprenylcysteine O-methyltransferase Ste14
MIEKYRIVISRIFVIVIFFAILLSSSATEATWPLVGESLFCTGLFLVAIASMGRLWCSLYIAGYKTDVLVTQGPYSMSRNPLYFFSLLGACGVGLATETVFIPILIVFAFAAYYPLVIKNEESVLLDRHGEAFRRYIHQVPRFFPKLTGLIEPESYTVKPRVYKRHMVDALWFVWIAGFLEIVESLHQLAILPTLFWIY